MGGTVKTVGDGRARVNRLAELLAVEDRAAASFEALIVGIETSRATLDRAFAIADEAVAAGRRGVIAVSESFSGGRGLGESRPGDPWVLRRAPRGACARRRGRAVGP